MMALVAVHELVDALYLAPMTLPKLELFPPQMIISAPVHTAVWLLLEEGAFVGLVAVQLSSAGLYRAPNIELKFELPPHMIITFPVHTAVCPALPSGAPTILV